MDFIFMLTRDDRTIEDAEEIVDAACELGVRHIGFKDIGVPRATLRARRADRIRRPAGRLLPRGGEYNTRGDRSARWNRRGARASTASSAAPISTRRERILGDRSTRYFPVSGQAGRPSDAA